MPASHGNGGRCASLEGDRGQLDAGFMAEFFKGQTGYDDKLILPRGFLDYRLGSWEPESGDLKPESLVLTPGQFLTDSCPSLRD